MAHWRYLTSFVVLLLILGCNDSNQIRNPFLQEIGFRFEVDLNLPLYSPLNTTGNPVYIGNNATGIRGVFVMNTGFETFRAFEATCPNHAPNSCSTMRIDGQVARCDCEDYTYSLFTGQLFDRPNDDNRYYNMLEYRASRNGNTVIISN